MLTPAEKQFVQAHFDADLHRLALSAGRFPEVRMPVVVAQIEAFRKVREKIPSWFRFDLVLPPALSVEQASSESCARFKGGLFSGRLMADLTGGMGVDAYFFSQSFERVVYVEQNPDLFLLARHNFDVLGAANINAIAEKAEHFLAQNDTHFDLLYLDPARRDQHSRRVVQLDDCQPNVLDLLPAMLQFADRVLLKTAPMLDLQQAVRQLGAVSRIWVLSVDQECREVLYLLENREVEAEDIPIEAVRLGEVPQIMSFTGRSEREAPVTYAEPGAFLYEPDPAVLKAGGFKTFAHRYGLAKLHPNTHLYTSAAPVPDVPGRCFAVEAVLPYKRQAVSEAVPEGKANVAVRNFPDTVEQMRKKLRLKDGGDRYVFGATHVDHRPIVLVCRRLLDKVAKSPASLQA